MGKSTRTAYQHTLVRLLRQIVDCKETYADKYSNRLRLKWVGLDLQQKERLQMACRLYGLKTDLRPGNGTIVTIRPEPPSSVCPLAPSLSYSTHPGIISDWLEENNQSDLANQSRLLFCRSKSV